MPSLYLSAAHKSSGKTTLTLGLARTLRARGLTVQTFKKGPDYIDPIWHGQASARPCYNLDFHMMGVASIRTLFARHAATADIALIEGNKGLYDGMDLEGGDSNAALAKLLGTPVVLVVDTQGMTRGVAPLLQGYQSFDRGVDIAGVILNRVGGPRHEDKLRAVIERYTDLPVLGAVPRDACLHIEERHLGLIPGNESEGAEARIEAIATLVGAQVDVDGLVRLARRAALPSPPDTVPSPPNGAGLRIACAQDRAFGFYYQEDLDTLRDAGVELLRLNTLEDAHLPEVDGLILGGGFPEVFIEALEANRSLRDDIRRAIEDGLPVYAECGGLMYLSRSIAWEGRRGEMVGIVPADCVMGDRPVGRGYALLDGTGSSALAPSAVRMPAHEFHHSHLVGLPEGLTYAYRVRRGHGIDGRHDGYVYKNLLASYCHRRGTGEQGWIAPFLDKVRAHARQARPTRRAA